MPGAVNAISTCSVPLAPRIQNGSHSRDSDEIISTGAPDDTTLVGGAELGFAELLDNPVEVAGGGYRRLEPARRILGRRRVITIMPSVSC
ncbi:hypothetical protein [Nonomuraea sp. NPDC049158]|uniref:hypothetical protein n=1 Tax=Nonomuraea sp. NPDC049158 TaxID=3155649 RepID=UPI0033F5BE1A